MENFELETVLESFGVDCASSNEEALDEMFCTCSYT